MTYCVSTQVSLLREIGIVPLKIPGGELLKRDLPQEPSWKRTPKTAPPPGSFTWRKRSTPFCSGSGNSSPKSSGRRLSSVAYFLKKVYENTIKMVEISGTLT